MSNLAFVGLPRYSLGSIASGASSPVNMPLSRVADTLAWSKARLLSADPRLTYVEAVPTMPLGYYGPTPSVGGIAWANHSLGLGATARSLALSSGASGYTPFRVLPNLFTAVIGSWTGSAADIDDDPHSIDGNRVFTNSSGLVNAWIDFETPSRPPVAGEDRQMFRIALSYDETPTSMTFSFYRGDNGQLLKTFVFNPYQNPVPESGSVVSLPWDADLIAAVPDGSSIQLRIFITKPGTGEFAFEAVDALCEGALTAGSILADTGWLPATMDQYDAAWGATVSGTVGRSPQQTLVHVFSGNIANVAKVVTMFRDPLNSSGYIDLGEMIAGPQFVPRFNRDWGSLVKLLGRDTITELESGADAIVRREVKRQMTVPLSFLEVATEAYSLLERLHRAGAGVPFAVAEVPDSVVESTHTALYVRCTGMPELTARPGNVDFRALSIELTEAL